MRADRVAVLFALWGAAAAAAPQERIEPPVLSIRTDLVTLPVTVLDRRGALVRGLRPEHFRVYDSGQPQTIQFFSSDDLPATIGLLVDASGSMRGRRDEIAEASAALAGGRSLDEFFTINFNERAWPGLPPHLLFTQDGNQLRAALAAAPARGLTALYDAIHRALAHVERGSRDRKALILVSDGGDNASAQTLDAVVDQARRTNVAMYAITLDDPDNRDARPRVLKTLARETGGRTFTARRPAEVAEAFAQIAREIRSGYTIGFAPPDVASGGFRTVRVVVDAGDERRLTARTRAGYYAEPPE